MKRKWLLVALVLAVVAVAAFAMLDPDARLKGWVGGQPFFHGRAASAWGRELAAADDVASAAARKTLTDGKGEAVPVCQWLLEHSTEAVVRARSADALKQMGPDAKPAGASLLKAADDPDPVVKGVALQALEGLAPELPADAMAKIEARLPETESFRILAKFGPAAAPASAKVKGYITHADSAVRFQAVRALGKIGPTSIPYVPEFIVLLEKDGSDKVREIAAEVIGMLGPAAARAHPDAIPALGKALADPAWNVRRDAVRSLGQMGALAKSQLEAVKARQKDDDERVRGAVAKAVRQIEGTEK
jgi:HEAT repeat protein